MKRPLNTLTPSAITTGLVAPLALAAPGNLDPGFADHGRAVLDILYGGQAWSVEALDDGELFVAGGDLEDTSYNYCSYWYYCDYFGSSFANELAADGAIKASYMPAPPAEFEVRDAARLPDGTALMVGRKTYSTSTSGRLAVYRLDASGAIDNTFGTGGIFVLPTDELGFLRHIATSVALDPEGRIVVAGSADLHLIAVRLLTDGTLDTSFGENGVFVGPEQDYDSRTFVERTAAGGYRITATGASECQVVGLTANGTLDNSFGTAGIALAAAGEAASCGSMASQADGSLLVGGSSDGQGFLIRMLGTGALDGAFATGSIADSMTEARAIAIAGDGKILVAGTGEAGATVMRLEADGNVDASFGEAGATLIDLPVDRGTEPQVNALDVGTDGRILAAGGDRYTGMPFVVQLVGDGGNDNPGVVGFSKPFVEAAEGADAVIKVRRTGGKAGAVSVRYRTALDYAAAVDEDFSEVSGTLHWADGDASEREIIVPVLDDEGDPEEYEAFQVVLREPGGGAGLGARINGVTILPDGAPAGQFAIGGGYLSAGESGPIEFWVYRNYYTEGEVSVTVTPTSGSAQAGEDFDATPVTLSWADQDSEPKSVQIAIVDDDEREGDEAFTVQLSNPTGGAVVGPHAPAEFTIDANDGESNSGGGGGGGGGTTGWLSLLLLLLAESFRSWRAATRRA